ncbi:DNA polymerase III subunit gamma/tau [Candidatus Shapirobacteria bacterium]|nr:DNA polymerase III subunit gamma/tau [Candidatus Shapirobacteria bacterium]
MSVFHLKYRPKKIAELDLMEVADKIKSIVLSADGFQSLLFAGPKGSGKTSAARILAKAVNCLNLKEGEPCGECANCLEIEKGNSLDIIEMDAASNRGIDDVRSLKDNAYLSPVKLKKKIFIIDEVHMLTKEAFNALLKLIEEPPKNTIFVLCTTDSQKIPETVLSRLMKVNFRKGGEEELANSLKKIIKGEGIEIDEKASKIIIDNSDGSFRNISRTLNEIFLRFGKKISKDEVETYFGEQRGEYAGEELEGDLNMGKMREILEKLETMAKKGIDFSELRLQWMQYFHQKMLQNYDDKKFGKWIEKLIWAGELEKTAGIEQLPLELAVMEMGDKTNYELRIKNYELENKENKSDSVKSFVEVIEEAPMPKASASRSKKEMRISLEEVEKKWTEVLQAVKPYNHSVEAFLRGARPKKVEGGVLVIDVFYKFHKEKLEEAKNRKIVEIGLDKVFGKGLEFECVLADGRKKKETGNEKLETREKSVSEAEIYDVAKDIFG